MKALFSSRRALTVTVGVAVATVVGVAVAAWLQTGTGNGEAKSLTARTSTVTVGTAAADLYPGFTGGDLYVKVDNPNPYPVRFTSLTPGAVTSSNETGCPASNVTVASRTNLTINVPANTTTAAPVEAKVDDVVTMLGNAPDGCQGKTFTIAVTLTGAQVTTS